VGALELNSRSIGEVECWSNGELEYWSFGVLEFWSDGVMETTISSRYGLYTCFANTEFD
jgi:hypothetical protein